MNGGPSPLEARYLFVLTIPLGQHMGVGGERDLRARVAQALGDLGDWLALGQQQGSTRIAKVLAGVSCEVLGLGLRLCYDSLEAPTVEVLSTEKAADLVQKNQRTKALSPGLSFLVRPGAGVSSGKKTDEEAQRKQAVAIHPTNVATVAVRPLQTGNIILSTNANHRKKYTANEPSVLVQLAAVQRLSMPGCWPRAITCTATAIARW